jgi:hypothetical protein
MMKEAAGCHWPMRPGHWDGYAAPLSIVKESGGWTRRFQAVLTPEPRDELLESLDRAASPHPRVDGVALGAQSIVLRLKVKAAVEVEPRTIFVELRTDARVIDEDEVDLFGTLKQGALDGGDGHALGAFLLYPFHLRHERARLNRHAQDHFVLDDQPGDGLADRARLPGEQAEQERQQAPE